MRPELIDETDFLLPEKKLIELENKLKQQGKRNHLLFLLPFECGIGFLEMLQLKVGNIHKGFITTTNVKTGIVRDVPVNGKVRSVLREHIEEKEAEHFLIARNDNNKKPLEVDDVLAIALDIYEEKKILFFPEFLHRSFGYLYYKRSGDLQRLTEIYGFNTIQDTRYYIALENKFVEEQYMKYTGL